MNPDGYEFSRSSSNNRFWRKNRRRLDEASYSSYYGVDLNRNFPFQWGLDSGSSGVYYQETYRGPSANSEVETQAFINFIHHNQNVVSSSGTGLNSKHSLAALFSFHNYGGSYLIPPGYAQNVYTETFDLTRNLLEDCVEEYHQKLFVQKN